MNIWRPTIFYQVTKSFVSWQLSFVRSSYFANLTNIKVPLTDVSGYTKYLIVSDATKLQKQKIGDYRIFKFLQMPN